MTKKQLRILAIALLSLVSLLYGWMARNAPEGKKIVETPVFVDKVFDGDTVGAVVQGVREHIRLIGIDAPETAQKPWGRRSRKFLEAAIAASGWQLVIEYDIERRDKYGRVLAYLWTRQGKMLNEEMIRNGFAALYTFPPNVKHVDRLRTAHVVARENKLGIWAKDGLKQLPSDYRKEHPRK